jgi:hypothetical protein
MITFHREFPVGVARVGELRLVDMFGQEQPVQLWRVKKNADGSVASARVSFSAELAKCGSFRYELQSAKPGASQNTVTAHFESDITTLHNGLVALRLPKLGEFTFNPPLAIGSDHATMAPAYGRQVVKGIAPGPIQGVRLVDGRWAGGSYFRSETPDTAPKVTGYSCRITEHGLLFVEMAIRYTFSQAGWYGFTVRMLKDDPAVRIDEQFDMGAPGSMRDFGLAVSLGAGWQEGDWKPMWPTGFHPRKGSRDATITSS